MKCASLSTALFLFASAALAQETPFAQQPYRPGASNETMVLSLGDLMGIAQWRHLKLWQAGKAENWKLVAFEADKLKESLYRAALLYVNIPTGLIKAADAPLTTIGEAAAAGNAKAFATGFAKLTEACNTCHVAGGIGFVRMRTPTASPFSNQDFTPVDR